MDNQNWTLALWQAAGIDERIEMLNVREAEPTFLTATALGDPSHVDGLTRSEADDLVAHALLVAMERLEATLITSPSPSSPATHLIHMFSAPAWVRELTPNGEDGHVVRGELTGTAAGFLRFRRGKHSEWTSEMREIDLSEITTPTSVTSAWRWAEPRNLADLTHVESDFRQRQLAHGE